MSETESNDLVSIDEKLSEEIAPERVPNLDDLPTQNRKALPLIELPRSTGQIDTLQLEKMFDEIPEVTSIALSARREPGQAQIQYSEHTLLLPIIDNLHDDRLKALVLAWFRENLYFRAQVMQTCKGYEIDIRQKLIVILDLLDTFLDERRKHTKEENGFYVCNENLLLLRKYRFEEEKYRFEKELGSLHFRINESEANYEDSERKFQELKEMISVRGLPRPSIRRKASPWLVKGFLLSTFFIFALIFFFLGFIDIAAVMIGLAAAQLLAEIFTAIGIIYGGKG